jgi:hypothetical protein
MQNAVFQFKRCNQTTGVRQQTPFDPLAIIGMQPMEPLIG